jgi:hypothetical protein
MGTTGGQGSRLRMDRLHRSGIEPLRLLVLGDRMTLIGEGADLPSRIASELCYGTVRGADVDVLTDLTPVLGAVRGAFADWRLWRYDAVLVVFDSRPGRGRSASRRHLRALLEEVAADASVATRMLVASIEGPAGRLSRLRPAASLDDVVPHDDRILVEHLSARDDRPAAERAAEWCSAVGGGLRRVLLTGPTAPHEQRRQQPDDEAARQAALDELDLVERRPDVRLHELLELARMVFGTASAEINVLDHDRQWKVAVAGGDPGPTPRLVSFCNRTIQGEGPLVVADAAHDPAFAGNPLVNAAVPIRFYAGHPLESVDGYRIGTLCVYDPAPRDPGSVNLELLRDLALLVQAEITGRDVAPREPGAIRAAAA